MNTSKLCIIGEAGVGKTTLVKLLTEQQLNDCRKPTVGVAVERVEIGNDALALWDLAGQKRFQFMWDEFMRGSKLTVVVTDSSQRNVEETKRIVERLQAREGSKLIAIANKQDLTNRMSPEEIQQQLGIPTFGMIAIQRGNEDSLKEILLRNI